MSVSGTESATPFPVIRIFVDFDGTISPVDVGELFFRRLCGDEVFDAVTARRVAGEISGIQMYEQLLTAARGYNEHFLKTFLSGVDIDPAFPAFVQWCRRGKYPVTVLSDGFDLYIEAMMTRHAIALPLFCNTLRVQNDILLAGFPYSDERCFRTANCKANHVALESADDDTVVYIGDGRSDFEAATMADLVFARGVLETFCQKENITFRRFSTFTDVRIVLSGLISQKKLRRRKRAELQRRQLWLSG